MLTLEKRIQQWKKWINRNKQFSIEELEELENHLREEILYLTEHDKIPDQKAFDQALDILGEKGLLDEEFGKIRKSKFDKVKLWAYAQTILCIALIMFFLAPYLTPYLKIPNKDFFQEVKGDRIGYINSWQKDNQFTEYVSVDNEIFFANRFLKTIYHYTNTEPNSAFVNIDIDNVTFAQADYPVLFPAWFGVDRKNNVYIWNDSFDNHSKVDIFFQSALIDCIDFSEIVRSHMLNYYVRGLKVINQKIVIFFQNSENWDRSQVENLENSYKMLIYDLNTKQEKVENLPMKDFIMSIEQSEDELAFLTVTGKIIIYSLQNDKFVLLKELQIKNMDKNSIVWNFMTGNTSFLFSKYNHQMILKRTNLYTKDRKLIDSLPEYYFLKVTNEKELTEIPISRKKNIDVIKFSNRLVMIWYEDPRKSSFFKWNGTYDLYLFKD